MKPLLILVSALLAAAPASAHLRITLLAHRDAVRVQTTTLVTPAGIPVGGPLQRWVNESQMPTVKGIVVLVSPGSVCLAEAASCAARPESGSPPELAATNRQGLYFEMGHLFDWQHLTPADHIWLAHQWRDSNIPWMDSNLSIEQGTEDGLEGVFAAIYLECALDRHADIAGITLNEPAAATVVPADAQPRNGRSTCAFIANHAY